MGSRALYLYSGGKDTLFRIHGTNQPEYIGASISSGCIRMTNEDVIDLYDRVGVGTVVVVLEPKHGDSPFNSQDGAAGRRQRRWCSNRSAPRLRDQKRRFCRRFFVGCGLVRLRLGLFGIRAHLSWHVAVSGFAVSDLAASDLAATSRGGASSGRSAGNSGATCGSGSYTFHWQIR